jgi:cation:H+ antiporter
MADMINMIVLVIGLILLLKGADFFVEGSSALALRLKVPQIVIGLTVVAFGTSAPELIVSVFSAMKGQNEIAVANVVGSNLFNIFMILGITGLIVPLQVKETSVWREIPFSLIVILVCFVLFNDTFFDAANDNYLSRIDSIVLLALFALFIIYNFILIKADSSSDYEISPLSNIRIILYIILGLSALVFGGRLVVNSAVDIAESFHISTKIIGLTIVAAGTSLPELITSIVAARKGKADIAVGNVVGSNIFNTTLILGVSGLMYPIKYNSNFNYDMALLITGSVLLFIFMFTFKRHKLDRPESMIFLIAYVVYVLITLLNV